MMNKNISFRKSFKILRQRHGTIFIITKTCLMVHMAQHDASRRIPFTTFEALVILPVFSLQKFGREEVIDAEHSVPKSWFSRRKESNVYGQ